MERPSAAMLDDGKRLHLQHGPIDLIIEADGPEVEVKVAYGVAIQRFESVLDELVSELTVLRSDMQEHGLGLQGAIARTMENAVRPYWRQQVTPMAAVAGSVAEHMLDTMTAAANLRRAYVNNGGDIALHLTGDATFVVAAPSGKITIRAQDDVKGIATSGWRGRSYSLGIADAVTVIARTASQADVAATIIANAVDLPFSPKVARQPANSLSPDSDLGARLVTVAVDQLTRDEVFEALGNGVVCVQSLLRENLFAAVSLMLSNEVISLKCTPPPALPEEDDDELETPKTGDWPRGDLS